ncbi:MAG: hypothetical protein H0U76_15975 [Ktedonobacteraceae bacterium]|nr:hypothetical protein [Ktedonobacteraceae bacterium]
MQTANSIDYAVIACYFALMIVTALFVMRFNTGAKEYFRGGSRIPWLVAGLSAFMSGFSAWTFTGGAGVAYRSGIGVIGLYIGNALAFLLGYLFFAARWRRTRITTVMEYLTARFGQTTHQIFSWALIMLQLVTSAIMLFGLSLFISAASGYSVQSIIVVTSAIIIFYCVVGGLWAVVMVDFLQASILLPFCLVLVIASLNKVGGLLGLVHGLPHSMLTIHMTGEFGFDYLILWAVIACIGYNTSAMAQRYFSVEDETAAKRVSLLCCGLFFLGAFIWFIPPMAMRILYPDLHAIWPALPNPSEAAYVVASLTLLPHGLIGIMLAAMFSTTMANLSALFNLESAILTKDIYQELIRKTASERELLIVGWVNTLLIGGVTMLIAIMLASSRKSIFEVMVSFELLRMFSYGVPALLGLAIKKAPWWSGLASFTTGLILGTLGDFVYHWTYIEQVVIVLPITVAVFLLSMLFDRGDTPARAKLFHNLDTPINVQAELSDEPDYSRPVFRFLSRAIAFIALASMLLLVTTAPAQRATILWFAAITLGLSGCLWFLCGRDAPATMKAN